MKKDAIILAGSAAFLLTSLLILSACGRSGSDASGVPTGVQQDFSSSGQDFSGFDYGDGEVGLTDPTLAPNSNGDQPAIPGLTEFNSTNGPMNLPQELSGSQLQELMQPFQQLFAQQTGIDPKNLPQPIQDVLKQWWCQAQAQQQAYVSSYLSGSTPYDIVTGHYLDLLGRFPEPAGHQHWMSQLLSFGPRKVSLGILGSQEYAHRKAREWAWHFLRVTPAQATLNNTFTYLKNHKDEAKTGSIYGGQWAYTIEFAMARFLGSYEGNLFWNRTVQAANGQVPYKYQLFVQRAVQALLGRNPASWEVEELRKNKNYHNVSHRRMTAIDILHSDEYRLKFITSVIKVFLNRQAVASDYSYLMGRFRAGYDMISVMADILSSNNYAARQAQRFHPVANQCGG